MIQVVPHHHVTEPRIGNLDWSAFHQALAVVRNIVSEAVGPGVSIGVSANHYLCNSPMPEDKDFTQVDVSIHTDELVGISAAPRIIIYQNADERLDCNQFLKRIEDGCGEIIHVWNEIADGIRKARRLVEFVDDAAPAETNDEDDQEDVEEAPETVEDIRPRRPAPIQHGDVDEVSDPLYFILKGLDAEASVYGDGWTCLEIKNVAGTGEDISIPVASPDPKAAVVALRTVADEIGALAASIEERTPKYAAYAGEGGDA